MILAAFFTGLALGLAACYCAVTRAVRLAQEYALAVRILAARNEQLADAMRQYAGEWRNDGKTLTLQELDALPNEELNRLAATLMMGWTKREERRLSNNKHRASRSRGAGEEGDERNLTLDFCTIGHRRGRGAVLAAVEGNGIKGCGREA